MSLFKTPLGEAKDLNKELKRKDPNARIKAINDHIKKMAKWWEKDFKGGLAGADADKRKKLIRDANKKLEATAWLLDQQERFIKMQGSVYWKTFERKFELMRLSLPAK